jgi:hypothetical protein
MAQAMGVRAGDVVVSVNEENVCGWGRDGTGVLIESAGIPVRLVLASASPPAAVVGTATIKATTTANAAAVKVAAGVASGSIRAILEYEVAKGMHETRELPPPGSVNVHTQGAILFDPSAAISLLWLRRSLRFTIELMERLQQAHADLEDQRALAEALSPDETPPLLADPTAGCVQAAYDAVIRPFHSWLLRKTFDIVATDEGSIQLLQVRAKAGKRSYRPLKQELIGQVVDAKARDLNADGQPELVVVVRSVGSGSYGSVQAWHAGDGRVLEPITLPDLSGPLLMGYMGHDSFDLTVDVFEYGPGFRLGVGATWGGRGSHVETCHPIDGWRQP